MSRIAQHSTLDDTCIISDQIVIVIVIVIIVIVIIVIIIIIIIITTNINSIITIIIIIIITIIISVIIIVIITIFIIFLNYKPLQWLSLPSLHARCRTLAVRSERSSAEVSTWINNPRQ